MNCVIIMIIIMFLFLSISVDIFVIQVFYKKQPILKLEINC